MKIVYFDNSATTKPHKQVIDEVALCMEEFFANPSSAHRLGIEAEKKASAARARVGKLIGALPKEVIFTSGGSEANNTAILGTVAKGEHIITSKIEHPSVIKLLESMEAAGCEVTYLEVDNRGLVKLDQLEAAIKSNTRLITIMHVNNETGSIQPIHDIARLVREKSKKARIHADAVQSAGKLDLDVKGLDVDMLSLSAHKIHGPKGVGALYIKDGLNLKPLILGGGQERGIRSGTENLPGISGFGTAAAMALEDKQKKAAQVHGVKKHFIERLPEIDDIVINSPLEDSHIDNILNISFGGLRGEVLLHALEDYDIYVSTGSACSAKQSGHKNYVLPALGLRECDVEGAVRFSFSYLNTVEEVDYTIEALKKILPFLRRMKK
ncbi:MAG: cysteine desulfurase family protein [Clostridiaceae bacterium]|nr:cysteine desulfurase family protein [Clostridiaceae bacterium]